MRPRERTAGGDRGERQSGPGSRLYLRRGDEVWVVVKDEDRKFHKHIKDGEWNKYRVVARGPRIQTWISGQPVADLTHEEIYKTHPKGGGSSDCRFTGLRRGPGLIRWLGAPDPDQAALKTAPAGTDFVRSNPTCDGNRGQGGLTPCRRRLFDEEPWDTTGVPFVEPAVRTPPLALQSPRVGEGAYGTVSAAWTRTPSDISRRPGLRRGKGRRLASPTRVPWTRLN